MRCDWAQAIGGLKALRPAPMPTPRCIARLGCAQTDWIANLAAEPATALQHLGLPEDRRPGRSRRSTTTAQANFAKGIVVAARKGRRRLRHRRAIAMRRPACASGPAPRSRPPTSQALMPWLDWAFEAQKAALTQAAA